MQTATGTTMARKCASRNGIASIAARKPRPLKKPIVISNPRSGVGKSLQDVADKLVPQRTAGKSEGGGGKKFRRKG